MKVLLLALALAPTLLTGATQPATQPAPSPITYDEAVANEKKLFTADQAHDMDTLKFIVADDFVDIARDGSSIGKEALLKEVPTIMLLTHAQKNFRVMTLGPFAYSISYDSDATMIDADGKQVRTQNALNTVWIKRSGRWQILMHCRGEAQPLAAR